MIYVAADTDTKGLKLRDELVRRLGAERCRIVTYGEGCKDANEHLVKFGRESLLETLQNACEIKVEGVFQVSDFEEDLDTLYENELGKGVTLGFPNLDEILSFETGRLCVITGIPQHGKSVEWHTVSGLTGRICTILFRTFTVLKQKTARVTNDYLVFALLCRCKDYRRNRREINFSDILLDSDFNSSINRLLYGI